MIGIVLISADGYYLGPNGELPERPWFDKDLLLGVCKGMNILCSPNTEIALPESVRKVANTVNSYIHQYDVNLGISTFKSNPPDVMILVQSRQLLKGGRKFDVNWLCEEYKCLSPSPFILDSAHIWLRMPNKQLELDL
ncbi:MAG: hypothetical protein JHC33_01100 [Ignisphaera sp.]|nr:hypothetical protein [Ignisphaera sp.]